MESLLKSRKIKNWGKRKIKRYAKSNYLRVGINYSSLFILYVTKLAASSLKTEINTICTLAICATRTQKRERKQHRYKILNHSFFLDTGSQPAQANLKLRSSCLPHQIWLQGSTTISTNLLFPFVHSTYYYGSVSLTRRQE